MHMYICIYTYIHISLLHPCRSVESDLLLLGIVIDAAATQDLVKAGVYY